MFILVEQNCTWIYDKCSYFHFLLFRVMKESLLKVTNKSGKNLSPVGFVTFSSRTDAETAKQELTVRRK